jgi:hypothetical protein
MFSEILEEPDSNTHREKKRPMSMLSVMQLSFTRSPVAVWREYGIWQGDRTLGRMMLDKGAVLVKEKTETNEIC